ncbi:MAG: UDP-N-acetylmuramate dehydrogenase [Clostridia bacterium]|nr:UDP-N-acetylmuramate dehydrogenase [Clostridia bacterium]
MNNREEIVSKLQAACPGALILTDEPMSRHTTFRVGGPADILIQPSSSEEVGAAIKTAKDLDIPVYVMGNGSNMLVKDGGMEGIVVLLGERMSEIRRDGVMIYAEAGAMLSRLSREALNAGLKGLVFASGIPGTVGGAVVMNAGAYGGQMADVLVRAKVLCGEEIIWMTRDELEMGYRTTKPLREGWIVLGAEFELEEGDITALTAETNELSRKRREKQPLSLPSAGSTFKRPEGYFAGALIEQAGLKGKSIGGAQVSELHAGFVVNTGEATASDILRLIEHIQKTVYGINGVMLEPEVRIVGRD